MWRTLNKYGIALLLGLSILFPSQFYAQEAELISLKKVLVQLEQTYDIKFSFVDETVDGIQVRPSTATSLKDILENLRQKTKLEIKELNSRYYTISKTGIITICGRVLDNYAKNTIPGATIEVFGDDKSMVTDDKGFFKLSVSRDKTLKIRYLGFITKYIAVESLITSDDCQSILLSQFVEQLNEVVIYEYLTKGIKKQPDASITLKTNELGVLPGIIEPDVLQSIQALPGIKSIDETVSDINVRGGTNDQNLILWNGIKMYQSGHFFGLISAFNPYLTDKVSIFKNGTPTQFGDGVSSVISMETKNEVTNFITGGAGLNFISGDVFAQIPISEKLAFQFSARRSTTDFLNTPAYSQFTSRVFQDSQAENQNSNDNSEFDETFYFYDVSGKLLFDINNNQKIRLSFLAADNDLDFNRTNTISSETSNSLLDQTNFSVGLQLQSQWSTNFSSVVNTYFSTYNLKAENLFANQVQQLFQKNTVDENAVKIHTTYLLSDRLSWSNGYQYIETGITNTTDVSDPLFQSNVKGVIRIHAPYSQFNYSSANDDIIINGGARLNYIENLGTFSKIRVEPRLNVNFKLKDYWRAELLGEYKSQSTNQVIDLEQNFLGIEKRRWILSDENELPVTKSKQGSLGINYAKNNFYFGLEGFYKFVDGVSIRTQGFQNQNQFDGEIGSYQVRGVEFLVNQKGDKYSAWLSYTYNQNEYTFETLTPSTFPNNLDVRHTLNLAGTYTMKKFKMGVGINYRTGSPFTAPLADSPINSDVFPEQINFEPSNSNRLPEYLRLDASAGYDLELGRNTKMSFGFSVLNILNRNNILNRYFRITENNEVETVENVSLGLTPNASVRLFF